MTGKGGYLINVVREGLFNKAKPEQRPGGKEGGRKEGTIWIIRKEEPSRKREQQTQRPWGSRVLPVMGEQQKAQWLGHKSEGESGNSWLPQVGEKHIGKVPQQSGGARVPPCQAHSPGQVCWCRARYTDGLSSWEYQEQWAGASGLRNRGHSHQEDKDTMRPCRAGQIREEARVQGTGS